MVLVLCFYSYNAFFVDKWKQTGKKYIDYISTTKNQIFQAANAL